MSEYKKQWEDWALKMSRILLDWETKVKKRDLEVNIHPVIRDFLRCKSYISFEACECLTIALLARVRHSNAYEIWGEDQISPSSLGEQIGATQEQVDRACEIADKEYSLEQALSYNGGPVKLPSPVSTRIQNNTNTVLQEPQPAGQLALTSVESQPIVITNNRSEIISQPYVLDHKADELASYLASLDYSEESCLARGQRMSACWYELGYEVVLHQLNYFNPRYVELIFIKPIGVAIAKVKETFEDVVAHSGFPPESSTMQFRAGAQIVVQIPKPRETHQTFHLLDYLAERTQYDRTRSLSGTGINPVDIYKGILQRYTVDTNWTDNQKLCSPMSVDVAKDATGQLVNLRLDEGVLIYGAPSSGKTNLVNTILTLLSLEYSPKLFQWAGINVSKDETVIFSPRSPHAICAPLTFKDVQARGAWFNFLQKEVDRRAAQLSGYKDYHHYIQVNYKYKPLPRLLLVIENADKLTGFDGWLQTISSQWKKWGISLIATCTRLDGSFNQYCQQSCVARVQLSTGPDLGTPLLGYPGNPILSSSNLLGKGDAVINGRRGQIFYCDPTQLTEQVVQTVKEELQDNNQKNSISGLLADYGPVPGGELVQVPFCPSCNSRELIRKGWDKESPASVSGYAYKRYQCKVCNSTFKRLELRTP